MSRLLLVRHGETEDNSCERYWGHTDVKLSVDGLKQAERLRKLLSDERINTVYSSPLRRARVTAETIIAGRKLQVIECPELREVNFGEIEGLTFAEVSRLHPDVSRSWIDRDPGLKYPGGESVREFHLRVGRFINLLENHISEETLLVVAHAGVLRVLMCRLLGLELEHWRQFSFDLASLSEVETYPEGAILNRMNEICHLRNDE